MISVANPLFRLLILFFFAILFRSFIPYRIWQRMLPWAVALLFVQENVVLYTTGTVHFFWMVVYWLSMALIISRLSIRNFQHNRVFSVFFVFWLYWTALAIRAESVYFALLYEVNAILELVLVGYAVGVWYLETSEPAMKLAKPVLLLSFYCYFVYVRIGFADILDECGRATFSDQIKDSELSNNVNRVGLSLIPLVAMGVLSFVSTGRSMGAKVWKVIAGGSLLISVYFLIRTGSRNATLSILPCLWYFLKGGDAVCRKGGKVNRILLLSAIVVLVAVGVSIFMKDSGSLRAFEFFSARSGNTDLDSISSGRISGALEYLSEMSGLDHLIGKGQEVVINADGSKVMRSCLSIYVFVYHNSGIIGSLLFICFFITMYFEGRRREKFGRTALFFFAIWAITGIAENAGMMRGFGVRLMLGMSLALCLRVDICRLHTGWSAMNKGLN